MTVREKKLLQALVVCLIVGVLIIALGTLRSVSDVNAKTIASNQLLIMQMKRQVLAIEGDPQRLKADFGYLNSLRAKLDATRGTALAAGKPNNEMDAFQAVRDLAHKTGVTVNQIQIDPKIGGMTMSCVASHETMLRLLAALASGKYAMEIQGFSFQNRQAKGESGQVAFNLELTHAQ